MSKNQSYWASDFSSLSLEGSENQKDELNWIDLHIAKAKLALQSFKNEQTLIWVLHLDERQWIYGETALIEDWNLNTRYDLLNELREDNTKLLYSNVLRKQNTDHWFDIVIGEKDNAKKIMSYDGRFFRVWDRKLYDNLTKSDYEKYWLHHYYEWSSVQEQKFLKILKELQNYLWFNYQKTSEKDLSEEIQQEFERTKMLDSIEDSEYNSIYRSWETDKQAIRSEAGIFDITEYMRKKAINWLFKEFQNNSESIANHAQDYTYNFSFEKDTETEIEILDYDAYLQWEEKILDQKVNFTITSWYDLDYENWKIIAEDKIEWTAKAVKEGFNKWNVVQISSLELPKNSIVRFKTIENIPEGDWVDAETWEVITKPAHQKLEKEYYLITWDPKKYEEAKKEVGKNLV